MDTITFKQLYSDRIFNLSRRMERLRAIWEKHEAGTPQGDGYFDEWKRCHTKLKELEATVKQRLSEDEFHEVMVHASLGKLEEQKAEEELRKSLEPDKVKEAEDEDEKHQQTARFVENYARLYAIRWHSVFRVYLGIVKWEGFVKPNPRDTERRLLNIAQDADMKRISLADFGDVWPSYFDNCIAHELSVLDEFHGIDFDMEVEDNPPPMPKGIRK